MFGVIIDELYVFCGSRVRIFVWIIDQSQAQIASKEEQLWVWEEDKIMSAWQENLFLVVFKEWQIPSQRDTECFKTACSNQRNSFRPAILNLTTIGILGWIIRCCGVCPMHNRVFSSIPSLQPTRCQQLPPPGCDNQTHLQTVPNAPCGPIHPQLRKPLWD